MAAKQTCLTSTALKSIILNESHCKLINGPEKKEAPAEIKFSTEVSYQADKEIGDTEQRFTICMKMNLGGFNTKNIEDKVKVFEMSCVMTAFFSIIDDAVTDMEEINENSGLFALQMYPLLRQHVVDTLNKMGVEATTSPWDIGLRNLSLAEKVDS